MAWDDLQVNKGHADDTPMTQMMMLHATFTMIGCWNQCGRLDHEFKASVGTKFDHDIVVRLERLTKEDGLELGFAL